MTETREVGDCIGQGTAGAALVSQVNLDKGLGEYFGDGNSDTNGGISYGDIKFQPLAYQDDIMNSSKDVMGAQVGNIKLASLFEDKGLTAHPNKTCFIVCGSKNYKKKMEQELVLNPLKFGNFLVKQRASDRYLGQVLHEGGLEKCAEATVSERAGRIRGATMEIKSIIEDFQMQAMGGMMAAWELWERSLVPKLLSGAGTWFGGECKEAVKICDDLQNFYWRVMLKVPESCPKLALRCEPRMIGMKWRLWEQKILLLLRVKQQDKTTLSRQVYEEGMVRGWAGLGAEVREICKTIQIPDVNEKSITKAEVKNAIFAHHYKDMKSEMKEKSRKLEEIAHEDFREVQKYFQHKSVEDVRMAFRVRCNMVNDIPANFKQKYKNNESGMKCEYCPEGAILSQSHCLECPAWEEIRRGLDLSNIIDMATFFRKLITERERLENVIV